MVLGDADRLQQVFWNLLANAMKFTPEGGRVTVRLRKHAGTVHVSVSDTGAGISARLPSVSVPAVPPGQSARRPRSSRALVSGSRSSGTSSSCTAAPCRRPAPDRGRDRPSTCHSRCTQVKRHRDLPSGDRCRALRLRRGDPSTTLRASLRLRSGQALRLRSGQLKSATPAVAPASSTSSDMASTRDCRRGSNRSAGASSAQPLETKLAIRMELGGLAWRGYFPVRGELTRGRPDLKEGLYFGAELPDEPPARRRRDAAARPQSLPGYSRLPRDGSRLHRHDDAARPRDRCRVSG